jgi:hypothetical protein
MRAVFGSWHDLTSRSCVGAQLIGDHPPRRAGLLFQQTHQQAFRRFGIAPRLDDFVEDVAILIHGPPEPVLLACNGDQDLIEMPDVAPARSLAFEVASVRGPNFSAQRRTVS